MKQTQLTIIEPKKWFVLVDWRELYNYRELLLFFSWRDFLVRYRQTVMGVSWALIRPLVTMVVFTVIFGKLAKLPSNGVPYPLMAFAGVLPWQFISTAMTQSTNSVLTNKNMISKIYFPRTILPISAVYTAAIDFFIGFSILIALLIYYHTMPPLQVILLPIFFLVAALFSIAISMWLAALNVKYRDVKYAFPFIILLGGYISPVGFDTKLVPAKWQLLYSLNPVTVVIDGFRWCLLGQQFEPNWMGFAGSTVILLVFLFSGMCYFASMERTFADII